MITLWDTLIGGNRAEIEFDTAERAVTARRLTVYFCC